MSDICLHGIEYAAPPELNLFSFIGGYRDSGPLGLNSHKLGGWVFIYIGLETVSANVSLNYLILESAEGLVLLDHRAAWERILYEPSILMWPYTVLLSLSAGSAGPHPSGGGRVSWRGSGLCGGR
ncbi:MAG: hypothetical protein JWL81_1602 [Verrucomicrobiales bacterium]|nr:hypothetical protein [Verrucomicrobiales bacterium]